MNTFDVSLKFIAEFLKYLLGFVTQDEEDWFDRECQKMYAAIASNSRHSPAQGHTNQVVDPNVAHHPLTCDEALSLGWIFHVTDFGNLPSIQQNGLKTYAKGSSKGG